MTRFIGAPNPPVDATLSHSTFKYRKTCADRHFFSLASIVVTACYDDDDDIQENKNYSTEFDLKKKKKTCFV